MIDTSSILAEIDDGFLTLVIVKYSPTWAE